MDMTTEEKATLLAAELSKPVGAFKGKATEVPPTREVVRVGDKVEVTLPEASMESAAADVLKGEGLDPHEWEVTGFRRSEWGEGKVSTRFTYKRRKHVSEALVAPLTDAELDMVLTARPEARHPQIGRYEATAVIALGDTQFGKYESDPADVLARAYTAIDNAAQAILNDQTIGAVVVVFLGDHSEGFVSQGGANTWRTPMPLTDQIRLTRRLMLYAMKTFGELYGDLSMVAVPGNHDQAVRPNGKGVTTYDDSHDVECLMAVMDAAMMSSDYRDVKFFVPQTDELAVSLELSGTHVVFAHGHMARQQGKLMEWTQKQAFNRHSVYANYDLAMFGHFHSFYAETSGDRMVMVVPALETESTWYRHSAGVGGDPGLLALRVLNGHADKIQVIRGG